MTPGDKDYMTKTIRYSEGHKCQPNGVGDYELVCPKDNRGVIPGFVPFMLRGTLKKCQGCGKNIYPIDLGIPQT